MENTVVFWAMVAMGSAFAVACVVLLLRLARLSERLGQAQSELDSTRDELLHTQRELTQYRERAVVAEATLKTLGEQHGQMKLEFKATATSLFEEMSTRFSQQSEKKIGDLLSPLRERLGEFQKKIDDSFSQHGKEQHTLKAEIEKIVLRTDSLTKALRGDAKAQGNWGEVLLERLLEESGLRRDVDYVVQASDMKLASDTGSRQIPDVIVRLPDQKHIIIDAKVSLTAYERYLNATDETQKATYIRDYLRSVKSHVTGLEQRRYQHNEKLSTPDFVLMFMPTEGAFSFALEHDNELHAYAWGRKVVMVSPTTLFATLRTIASIWRVEQQNRYALEIAEEGGKMYDKLAGFVQDMLDIGKQIGRSQQAYDQALSKLHTGSGNLVGRAEKMRALGAKATKALPKEVESREETDVLPLAASDMN
jgi:DNA recombination protein RmuC